MPYKNWSVPRFVNAMPHCVLDVKMSLRVPDAPSCWRVFDAIFHQTSLTNIHV